MKRIIISGALVLALAVIVTICAMLDVSLKIKKIFALLKKKIAVLPERIREQKKLNRIIAYAKVNLRSLKPEVQFNAALVLIDLIKEKKINRSYLLTVVEAYRKNDTVDEYLKKILIAIEPLLQTEEERMALLTRLRFIKAKAKEKSKAKFLLRTFP